MSYDLAAVAHAVADTLDKSFDGTVKVHPFPVQTFNVPAVIVAWPDLVEPSRVAPSVDRVRLPVMCAVGLDRTDQLSMLMEDTAAALYRDRSLGGLARQLAVAMYRNYRAVNVAGADFLTAELLLDLAT
ncbi:MAG TPA: hypothetical protein VLL25_14775 [Acidimicrobiales bacterium]|nr:hypothetical protein [Acidimicrobiales bacterium]